MKGTAIIIAVVHWHFTWQSQHNMSVGLIDHGYRVLYVEPIPKRWPRLSEFKRVAGRITGDSLAAGLCEQPLPDGIKLVTPRMPPDVGPLMQGINRHLLVPSLAEKLLQDVVRPLVVINYLPVPASLALMDRLKPDATFYHCINDWVNDPYAPAGETEVKLASKVDMVWADSPTNFARTRRLADHVVELKHGVDIDLFAQARKEPGPAPDRPLCAYFGTIGLSHDLDVLRAVSHRYPLRLIGPLRASLEGFSPETEVIGPVPHEQIPALLRDVDVLLLPYARSAHNDSVMPAKLFECLATGKPTVVCGLKTLYDYQELFYIRETTEEFLEAIAVAAHESPALRAPRIARAEERSYSRRMETVEGYIQQTLKDKASSRERAGDSGEML